MPKPKHQKLRSLKRAKKRVLVTLEKDDDSKPIRIRGHQFAHLKKNPDFIALVKVGRVVNAVSFGIQCIDDYLGKKSPVGTRQQSRALLVTGGYLFEGLALVSSLQLKYIGQPFFAGLNELLGPQYKTQYKLLQELRHSVGFHLDSKDKTTKATIESMPLHRYLMASGEGDSMLGFYFDFADHVDLYYLAGQFNQGQIDDKTIPDMVRTLMDMFVKFQTAGHEFLIGLSEKLELWNFMD